LCRDGHLVVAVHGEGKNGIVVSKYGRRPVAVMHIEVNEKNLQCK
jgi:hypothetical protein